MGQCRILWKIVRVFLLIILINLLIDSMVYLTIELVSLYKSDNYAWQLNTHRALLTNWLSGQKMLLRQKRKLYGGRLLQLREIWRVQNGPKLPADCITNCPALCKIICYTRAMDEQTRTLLEDMAERQARELLYEVIACHWCAQFECDLDCPNYRYTKRLPLTGRDE